MFSRRRLLGYGGLSAGALALGGCATMADPHHVAGPASSCLPPVHVADDRVIRTVVGLRPYRPAGFVVRAEPLGESRLLVHNYGHGGSGITLSWGSSKLAVDLGAPGRSGAAAVIGAGAMGLTTARLAQEAGFDVTIYTMALPPETTSNIAGGQWHPSYLFDRSRPLDPAFQRQLEAAGAYSSRRFQILVGKDYGVRWMVNWDLRRHPSGAPDPQDAWLAALMPETTELAPGQHPFGDYWALRYDGMIIETPVFLRRMLEDFHIAGGRVVVKTFASRQEVAALPESLVFNCSGLGARDLFGDQEMHPLRGQLVVLLPQEEVTYAVVGYDGGYMFSRSDGVLIGGTAERDNWSLEPDLDDSRRILEVNKTLFSQMRCVTGPRPL